MEDLATRIDRIESYQAIQQLPIRYALAVDGRDVDAYVNLFVDNVNCGRHGVGRDALKAYISPLLTHFYRSMHQICGQRIDFADADHATGATYCRAEHEVGDKWIVMAICYFDTYERRNGEWFFVRRKERHWYAADLLERPSGPGWNLWPGQEDNAGNLPAEFPAWGKFWRSAGEAAVAQRTSFPVG